MRAGPLSDAQVISTLNRYFVPVYAVNEDYRDEGSQPPEERAQYQRIYREALDAGMSTGTVHVYLVGTDGHPFDSLHVAEAAKTPRLIAMLERAIAGLPLEPGESVVPPRPQSKPLQHARDAMLLHLVARGFREGSWREFPGENWLVLDASNAAKFVPPDGAQVGHEWQIDPGTSARLLTYVYPQTENNDVSTNRLDEQSLRARLVERGPDAIRVRLDGRLTMKHAFYPGRDDDHYVTASLVGYIDLAPGGSTRRFRLVTHEADYAGESFGAFFESMAEADSPQR